MNAKQSLSSISANQELWVEQFRQEMFERDYNSGMSAAKSEGIAIGEARGVKRAKFEAARNLIEKHLLSFEDISDCTGLPLETVQQLAKEMKEKV